MNQSPFHQALKIVLALDTLTREGESASIAADKERELLGELIQELSASEHHLLQQVSLALQEQP